MKHHFRAPHAPKMLHRTHSVHFKSLNYHLPLVFIDFIAIKNIAINNLKTGTVFALIKI
jgi:hypothetical protein